MLSKVIKHTLVVLLIFALCTLLVIYEDQASVFKVVLLVIIVLFILINRGLRKSLAFKKYFTHPLNILTTKFRKKRSYNLPIDLMFDKLKEVINDSEFRLVDADKASFEILAISDFTFKSWGENLYFTLEEDGDQTKMTFCSTTVMQLYSWGKNEENYEAILNDIDRSLII